MLGKMTRRNKRTSCLEMVLKSKKVELWTR